MSIIFILLVVGVAFYYFSGSFNTKSQSKKQSAFQDKNTPKTKGGGSSYGKWVGGGLGWAVGGPIGGLIGFMFGNMFDAGSSSSGQRHPYQEGGKTRTGDFSMSLLVLSAAVMKADGTVKKSELDYVRRFFSNNFGEEQASQQMLVLRELLKKDINLQEVSVQIGSFMDYSSRLQLLHYLFGIALADGHVDNSEVDTISSISGFMRISKADYSSVKAMFVKDTGSSYMVLEVEPTASDEEVKKAYKKMAVKYHPDKVSHLGSDVQNAAEDKFQMLNSAYTEIKKQRGMN